MENGKAKKQSERGKAKSPRPPKWVDTKETDPYFADKWRQDCPAKYLIALYYLCGELDGAYWDGKYNAPLNRAFIEALEIVAYPQSAGTDAAAVEEMAAEVAESAARWRAADKTFLDNCGDEIRSILGGVFIDKRFIDDERATMRRHFLHRPMAAAGLRVLLKTKEADKAIFSEFLKTQTPSDEDLKTPARVRADWLNDKFSFFADCSLMRWLDFVELPQTFATEKLRAEIADNYGLFPLPFSYAKGTDPHNKDTFGREYVRVSESLLALLRLLKIAVAKQGGTVDGMTQKQFSKMCGVSPETVQNWDKGKTAPKGLNYTPRFYMKDAKAAFAFAARYREMNGGKCGGIIHGYAMANRELARQYAADKAADLRRI